MNPIKKIFLGLSGETGAEIDFKAIEFHRRWYQLCERYLCIKFEDSVWRFNRTGKATEPPQGWKIHISATILEACEVFEKVVPLLISEDVQFKAPKSLDELSKINCGLQYGYRQVGKFITVYPATEYQFVSLAGKLHTLTKDFIPVPVPFDEQYLPDSSVFYRYGAFSTMELIDQTGGTFPAIKNLEGELVADDRLQAVPDWVSNPFQNNKELTKKNFEGTPLGTTYRVFRAITQRGKGGTYEALDFSRIRPQRCIVKEGRRSGEITWNRQDGYFLVRNEFEVLKKLKEKYDAVPQVFESFEVHENFYFAMEYVEGRSLHDIIKPRRRRLSIRRIIKYTVEIAKIINNIHQAGWIWNDCKPANLIASKDEFLRPIDFEGAYPIGESEPFDWKTSGFSKTSSGKSSDIYALGAVIYFLLTGSLYDGNQPVSIEKLRRNVPPALINIIEKLLSDTFADISDVLQEFNIQKDTFIEN